MAATKGDRHIPENGMTACKMRNTQAVFGACGRTNTIGGRAKKMPANSHRTLHFVLMNTIKLVKKIHKNPRIGYKFDMNFPKIRSMYERNGI
jgi:hypothetical protein